MCGPSTPKDNSAKKARREEEARQARIHQGVNNIDLAFEGFNKGYFDKYSKDFQGFYLPQLDSQYGDAKRGLTYNLARSGNLEASTGAKSFGDAEEKYLGARTDIADRAFDSVNNLRGRIEDTKSNLYAMNASAADPGQAIARSTASASLVGQPQAKTPLGDVFASLLNGSAQAVGAERQGYRGTGTGLFAPPPGVPSYYNNYQGSAYIVP